jgi:hypothetical protein
MRARIGWFGGPEPAEIVAVESGLITVIDEHGATHRFSLRPTTARFVKVGEGAQTGTRLLLGDDG